jgi:pyruvate dehydrogenase E2 component (dihydrolipoamide acetyltransferase)
MATEVTLPQLGQTMEEGTILGYLVKVGDQVKKGDCIYEVETDKATLEVESPADGFVKHLLAEIGQTLLVGDAVLILGEADEQVPQSLIDSLKPVSAPADAETLAPEPAPQDGAPVTELAGTQQQTTPPVEYKLGAKIPLTQKQKITARKMLESKREIPAFYLNVKVDVTDLVELRAQMNKAGDANVSLNDFIMRAVAIALERFPIMTGQLAGDAISLAETIDIGLAIALPDATIAPVVRTVDKKNVIEIARESSDLVEKARNNKLTPADLQGACVTVSNLGALGVDSNTAIVVPGQCSILGVGRITETCAPENDNFISRKMMNLTLSVDHRITNGAYAGQFLDFVRRLLQDTANFT